MFTFLKIIKPFFLPPTLIAIGMLASLVFLFRKKESWGRRILMITFLIYYLLSIGPVAYMLSRSLEKNIIAPAIIESADLKGVQVFVVLAGGAHKKENGRSFDELGGISWKRLWHGIELYQELDGKVPILYSGGSGDPFDPVSKEAELAKQYAVAIGIPQEKFLIESGSRNTRESAVAVKSFLQERFLNKEQIKIILITSAQHMPRSLGVMNKAGITVIPSAADFTDGALKITPLSFFPSAGSFSSSIASIHEWVGILGYYLLGWI